jgi:hypothetical protein
VVVVKGTPEGVEIAAGKETVTKEALGDGAGLKPGDVEVVAKKDGGTLFSRKLAAEAGQRITLTWDPMAGELGVDVVDLKDTESVAEAKPEEGKAEAKAAQEGGAEEKEESPGRFWTWIAAGVGGAGFVGAAITGGIALYDRKEVDKACPGGTCSATQLKEAKDIQSTVDTLAITTDVLIAVGAVGVAAGVVLFFIEPMYLSGPSVTVAPAASDTSAGLSVSGSF